jgi:hypothetical protein
MFLVQQLEAPLSVCDTGIYREPPMSDLVVTSLQNAPFDPMHLIVISTQYQSLRCWGNSKMNREDSNPPKILQLIISPIKWH